MRWQIRERKENKEPNSSTTVQLYEPFFKKRNFRGFNNYVGFVK